MELATNSRVVLHQPDNFTIVRLQRVTAIVRMSVGMLARRRSTLLAAESWTRGIRGDEIPVYLIRACWANIQLLGYSHLWIRRIPQGHLASAFMSSRRPLSTGRL